MAGVLFVLYAASWLKRGGAAGASFAFAVAHSGAEVASFVSDVASFTLGGASLYSRAASLALDVHRRIRAAAYRMEAGANSISGDASLIRAAASCCDAGAHPLRKVARRTKNYASCCGKEGGCNAEKRNADVAAIADAAGAELAIKKGHRYPFDGLNSS